jgi:predicted alpha/beta superfamily hydrolase
MKSTSVKLALFIALFGVVNVISVSAQQPSATPTPTPATDTPASDSVIETKLYSAILNEERRVIVHLPRNYANDTSRKYPVMYVLDGTSQDQHTTDKATVLSDAGLIPSVIVIGLPNTRGNRERDQTPPYMRRDVNDASSAFGAGDKFLSFVEKELIPFVEGRYRTSSYRTLSGNSRGGLLVLYSLMEKPDLFQARFCYSTPVWRFDNLMVNRMAEFLRSSPARNNFLYLSVGEKETEQMVGGFSKMVETLKKIRKKGFAWVADYTPYAVHQDNALISTSKGLVEWGKSLKEIKAVSTTK